MNGEQPLPEGEHGVCRGGGAMFPSRRGKILGQETCWSVPWAGRLGVLSPVASSSRPVG